jgi:hypothetical protein
MSAGRAGKETCAMRRLVVYRRSEHEPHRNSISFLDSLAQKDNPEGYRNALPACAGCLCLGFLNGKFRALPTAGEKFFEA